VSATDPNTLYLGANVVFKSTDGGDNWTTISPDLTRNDKSKQQSSGGPITKDNTGVEVYDTIFSVVESPLEQGLIWAGSDDGLIHITRNGGRNWENVTPKAMPEWGTVSMIEASPFDAGTAYVAVERHKMDDFAPYAFKTHDYGKTWTEITSGIPKDVYVHAVREDPKRKGLLYAGTEHGIYVSFDDGAHWVSLQLNLPTAPVNDLIVKNNDLAVATHGRSFWILDDLSPLRQWQDSIKNDDVHLFTPAAANHTTFPQSFFGGGNAGQNPPAGAVFYYFLKNEIKKPEKKPEAAGENPAPAGAGATGTAEQARVAEKAGEKAPEKAEAEPVKIEILDESGKVIRTYPPKKPATPEADEGFGPGRQQEALPTKQGINRFVWDMHYEPALRIPNSPLWGGSTDGPQALPGKYQVRLTAGSTVLTQSFDVVGDPRLNIPAAEVAAHDSMARAINARVAEINDALIRIRDVKEQVTRFVDRSKDAPNASAISAKGKAIGQKADTLGPKLSTKAANGQDIINYRNGINAQYVFLLGNVEGNDVLTQPVRERFAELEKLWGALKAQVDVLELQDVPEFNKLLGEGKVAGVIVPKPKPKVVM